MIPVVAVVGKSKSGKTELMFRLISEFKRRGLRVAAVKHAHTTVELDVEGKDTWRYAQAGCDATGVSSPGRLTVFRNTPHEPTVEEVLQALGNGYDLALLEGFKKFRVPRIEVRHPGGEELLCTEEMLLAIVTDKKLPYNRPQFKRDEVNSIADFIEKEILGNARADVSVFVNGGQVFLKPFVKDFIGRTITGMLGSLKNAGIIKQADISIRASQGKPFGIAEE
jgi:molybdopterin-guanine dinucleotide biosynthesis protein B